MLYDISATGASSAVAGRTVAAVSDDVSKKPVFAGNTFASTCCKSTLVVGVWLTIHAVNSLGITTSNGALNVAILSISSMPTARLSVTLRCAFGPQMALAGCDALDVKTAAKGFTVV